MENRTIKKKLFDNSDWECLPEDRWITKYSKNSRQSSELPGSNEILAFTLFAVFPMKQSHDNLTKLG